MEKKPRAHLTKTAAIPAGGESHRSNTPNKPPPRLGRQITPPPITPISNPPLSLLQIPRIRRKRQPRGNCLVLHWLEWPRNLSLRTRILLNVVMLNPTRNQPPTEDDIARIRPRRNHRRFTQPQDGSFPHTMAHDDLPRIRPCIHLILPVLPVPDDATVTSAQSKNKQCHARNSHYK